MSMPEGKSTRQLTMIEAIREALYEEMQRDSRVFVMGEDVGTAGGPFMASKGLLEEFGSDRVRDTPISEQAFTGVAVGAAMAGLRPVIEIMFIDFATLAMDQLVNHAAKLPYMTGGQVRVPLVVRTTHGAGRAAAAQHSQTLYAWFAHVPGLKVAIPSTPYDAKGLLKSAIRDDGPVLVSEDRMLYQQMGPVPTDDYAIPLGIADVKRPGRDVTIIALSMMVPLALRAAEELAKEAIEVEVVDPRTLVPLDVETLVSSVRRTSRALVLDQACMSFGASAEIAAIIAQEAFDFLDAPVMRVCALDVPVPYSQALEPATIPNEARVMAAVRDLVGGSK